MRQNNNELNNPYVQGEISVKEIIQKTHSGIVFLRSKSKLIFLAVLIGALAGLSYALLMPPSYSGEVTFVLENNGSSKMGGYSGIAAQFGFSLPGASGGVFQGDDNMIAFIQSRNMIVRTLLSPDIFQSGKLLVDRYMAFNDYPYKWKNNKKLSGVKFYSDDTRNGILQDSLLNKFYRDILKENLSVGKPDKKNDVIAITTVAPDQFFAKAFSEKLLENVTGFYIETQTKKSLENVSILRFQVDSVRTLLNSALAGAAVSSDANPNMNPAFQRLRVPSQRRMVDVELNKAILSELVKQLEISEITLRKETPLVQIIDQPVLPLKKKEFTVVKGLVIGTILGFIIAVFSLGIIKYSKSIFKEAHYKK